MKRAVIYLVVNDVTGDTYIGVTQYTVADRWRRHVYTAMTAPRTRLHCAIADHGANAFSVTHIATCLQIEEAIKAEQEIISEWRPTYNQTNGGQFTVGKKLTPEIVAKIRAGNIGKKRTAEQNKANSEKAKERYQDPIYRAKILAALEKARAAVDRNKQRAAASKASGERVWSDASRAKLSASRLNLNLKGIS